MGLGAHFSIAKGLHQAILEAAAYGCDALQLFTKNSSTWKERELSADNIRLFDEARKKTGIHQIASHTSYLINLASPDEEKQVMSVAALRQELIRSSRLSIPYVILHPGSHMGSGEEAGITRIAEHVNRIYKDTPEIKTRLLFETTAGQGSSIGYRFEQLSMLLDRVENRKRTGICLDTSHIFAAGYDLRDKKTYQETLAAFDHIVGLKHLYVMHLNDSKKGLGSRVDRHEHIGRGQIGIAAFEFVMQDTRLANIPKIIETPKTKGGEDWDAVNLNCLRRLARKKE